MFYYKQIVDNQIVSVEAKSKASISPDFAKTTKAVYDTFIASLPVVKPEPARDLAAEIDELRTGQSETNEKLDLLLRRITNGT